MMEITQNSSEVIRKTFIVNANFIESFVHENRDDLKALLKRDHSEEEDHYINVTKTYFDTETLDYYRDIMTDSPGTQKLCLKSFYNAQNSEENSIFEVTHKNNGLIVKRELCFKSDDLDEFYRTGEFAKSDLLLLNKNREEIEILDLVDEIFSLIDKNSYRPILRTKFRRQSFKFRNKSGLRLTIDSQIQNESIGESCAPVYKYKNSLNKNEVVVELRVKDESIFEEIPQLMKILGENKSFSKFCFGIEETKSYLRETESIIGHEALCNARLDGDLLDLVKYQMDSENYNSALI